MIARSHLHVTSRYNFIRNISPKNTFMVLLNRSFDMLLFRCGGVVAHGWVIVELVALAGRKKVNGEIKALIQMEDVH